jgi:hypothetical protein
MDNVFLYQLNAQCTLGNQNTIASIVKYTEIIIKLLNSKYTATITTTQKDSWKELLNKQKNELIDAITKNESITTSLKAMISTKSIIKEVWLDEPITTMKEQFMNSMLELNIKKTVLVTLIKTIEHFLYSILLRPALTHEEVNQQLSSKLGHQKVSRQLDSDFYKSYSWSRLRLTPVPLPASTPASASASTAPYQPSQLSLKRASLYDEDSSEDDNESSSKILKYA